MPKETYDSLTEIWNDPEAPGHKKLGAIVAKHSAISNNTPEEEKPWKPRKESFDLFLQRQVELELNQRVDEKIVELFGSIDSTSASGKEVRHGLVGSMRTKLEKELGIQGPRNFHSYDGPPYFGDETIVMSGRSR